MIQARILYKPSIVILSQAIHLDFYFLLTVVLVILIEDSKLNELKNILSEFIWLYWTFVNENTFHNYLS